MLFVVNDGVTESRLRDITSFAIQHKILSIGSQTLFTSVGGAIYYGSNLQEIIDRSVSYVDRVLRGARPADLPVEQPTKFDLIINLKTVRALGISIPQSVLLRADEVIQ
ncbi:MAG TPA: ABC transporter substrate binding protein [Bradyrhizobium sp.]